MTDRVEHPKLGTVTGLPLGEIPKKVWKHFYAPREAWERITGCDIGRLRTAGESALGILRADHGDLPDRGRVQLKAFAVLAGPQHDCNYRPTYLAAIGRPTTFWADHLYEANRWAGRSVNGIFISVERAAVSWVVTAYRPVPLATNVRPSEADFQRAAHRIFKKCTTRRNIVDSDPTLDWLQSHAGETPQTPAELWSLAHAIGHARRLGSASISPSILAQAEATLRSAPASERTKLIEALDWSGALECLRAGLDDAAPDEFELALISVEEVLTVAEVFAEHAAAARFLADAETIIAWTPPAWQRIAEFAEAQVEGIDPESLAARLWLLARDSVLGALVRESLPAPRMRSSLADALLAAHGAEISWRSRLASLLSRGQERGSQFIDSLGWAPQPAMLSDEPVSTHSLRAAAWDALASVRVFATGGGADHIPEEVTEDLAGTKGSELVWEFTRPGDALVVMVFESTAPLVGATFEAVLEFAVNNPDVVVSVRAFTRPN